MTDSQHNAKTALKRSLTAGFDALQWKLEGLSEYDLRRPLVPTGTNLLGLAKHVAFMASGYFGEVFDRATALPAFPEGEVNADMWATADESSQEILARLATAAAEAAATIDALELDARGHVPWWRADRAHPSLHEIAVHMIAELHRHAGHADIVRELIDGEAGLQAANSNLPGDEQGATAEWWVEYRSRLQSVADSFR